MSGDLEPKVVIVGDSSPEAVLRAVAHQGVDAREVVHVSPGGCRAVRKSAAEAAMAMLADRDPVREFVLHTHEWMGPYGDRLAWRGSREAKPERKCRLPRCNVMHRHNGGYCCAEHCREHRGEIPPPAETTT